MKESFILADLGVFFLLIYGNDKYILQSDKARNDIELYRIVSFFLYINRKRQVLANVNECLVKKTRETNHQLSLMKMACATRTFWSQAEALEFITERQKDDKSDEILYLFSFESQPKGKRRYQVADIDIFIHEY